MSPPSCLALGYDRYLCVNCGKVEKRDYVDSLGHAMQQIVIRDATCEVDGKILNICARCGLAEVEYTPKGEHQYESYSIASTCTGPGYTVKECSVCGDRHITDMTEAQLCTVCGAVLANAKGHSFEETIMAQTCIEISYTEVSCKDCGLSYKTEYSKALGHNYNKEVTAPTCLEQGYTTYTCANCGDCYTADYTEATGHSWGEGKYVVNATYGGEVMIEYRCANCETVRLENEEAVGHTPGKEAICTEAQICTDCGAVIQQPTGHNMQAEVTPATCLEMGYTEYSCSNCNVSYKTEYTKPLGHNYKSEVVNTACLEKGYTTYTCQNDGCEDNYVSDYIEAIGHKWDNGTTVTDSVCNSEGMIEYSCASCNELRLEAKSALGHTSGKEGAIKRQRLGTGGIRQRQIFYGKTGDCKCGSLYQ